VATEKQIAANRANAQRSTGPRTAAGRLRSSRNAFRHGLSCPLRLDRATSSEVHAIANALMGEGATLAAGFAEAQCEVLRIRAIRHEMMAGIDPECVDTQELRQLASLDRYERYSLTRRRRAARKLELISVPGAEETKENVKDRATTFLPERAESCWPTPLSKRERPLVNK
jgi:hypothetical protein